LKTGVVLNLTTEGYVRRRDFIKGVVGSAVAWPLAARAQQAGKPPIIGFMGTTTSESWRLEVAAFEKRLRELGWIAGRTVTIEYRWTDGKNERAAAIAAEFVRLAVNVIVTGGNAVGAAKNATSEITIVFALAVDPVGSGFVESLSRPGGNVTGLSLQGPDVAGKRLGLLREVVPSLHRLAIIADASYPAAVKERGEVEQAARAHGLEPILLNIERAEDIGPAFGTLGSRAQALYVVSDALVTTNRVQITGLALGAQLPAIYANRPYTDAGGLMSYGPVYPDLFRRSADFVDKILRGTKPADLPVEQPTKFEFIINLKTAKTLGLTVPPTVLARADEVIE
jgi:putative tryptophan/tyrosine transport system substrate-binding protein